VVVVADAGRDKAPPASDEILALSDGRFGFRVADPITSERKGAFAYEAVREARKVEERAERLRLYYVAMTRAVDRLIVSGAIDPARVADETTPIGWALGRLDAREEVERAGRDPVELEREGARVLVRVDRFVAETEPEIAAPVADEDGQLALFEPGGGGALPPVVPPLPALAEIPLPPLHRVRRLSFSALALFERCSYRYYAERIAGMRPSDERLAAPGTTGLAATEIGDAVHRLLELVNLREPLPPDDLAGLVRGWYPSVTDEEIDRISAFVTSYCESALAARVASLDGVRTERPFAFVHDGVLLNGRLDVLQLDGERALVLDYKTNSLEEGSPEEIVESDYRLQRLVYALACFRAGAQEVEVVYHFLERPDAVVTTVFSAEQAADLEAELSAAIARINAGDFRPSPDEFTCAGCPALDIVCAGPRLRDGGSVEPALVSVS
jgi:ATP-dependent helicase/nuclease subunit A